MNIKILKFLSDLIPVILDKWADATDRPRMEELVEEQIRQDERMKALQGKLRWMTALLIVVFLWALGMSLVLLKILSTPF